MRIYKTNDNIKVLRRHLGNPPRWMETRYHHPLKNSFHSTSLGVFHYDDIRHYKPISLDEIDANGMKHAELIMTTAKKYMEALLPVNQHCEVKTEDGIIYFVKTPITIDPAALERETIYGSFDEYVGWDVNEWNHVYNYPHSPDDVEYTTIERTDRPEQAAALAIKSLWNRYAQNYFERENENATLIEPF